MDAQGDEGLVVARGPVAVDRPDDAGHERRREADDGEERNQPGAAVEVAEPVHGASLAWWGRRIGPPGKDPAQTAKGPGPNGSAKGSSAAGSGSGSGSRYAA